ncbi:MAG: adenylate/guanylate cyclase domain-containing protein [Nitrosomonas sp. PRO4]|nr:adenylate/guanylate cyclase domain-containing protein [Nitrosomonas sp. PRO4]
MAFKKNLHREVQSIFANHWNEREGSVVPTSENVRLGNDGVWLDATILYADIADSTKLVDNYHAHVAAEVYKAFLHCAAKIISSESGEITAYDGDRVMAVFIGKTKNTSAVRTALKINYAQSQIINPAISNQYPNSSIKLKHVCGIDTSKIFVARTGIRGANDLVWVGQAANYAAKLSALSESYPSRITEKVFNTMHSSVKTSTDGRPMWEKVIWNDMNKTIYRSTWRWVI